MDIRHRERKVKHFFVEDMSGMSPFGMLHRATTCTTGTTGPSQAGTSGSVKGGKERERPTEKRNGVRAAATLQARMIEWQFLLSGLVHCLQILFVFFHLFVTEKTGVHHTVFDCQAF